MAREKFNAPNPSRRDSGNSRHSSTSVSSTSGKGNSAQLEAQALQLSHSITDINNQIQDNTKAINDTTKLIHQLRKSAGAIGDAAMKQGEDKDNRAISPDDDIQRSSEQLRSAEDKLNQLKENRKELIKKLSNYRDKLQKLQEMKRKHDEQTKQKNDSKSEEPGNRSSDRHAERQSDSKDAPNNKGKERLQGEQKEELLKSRRADDSSARHTESSDAKLNPSRQKALDAEKGAKARYEGKAANKSAGAKSASNSNAAANAKTKASLVKKLQGKLFMGKEAGAGAGSATGAGASGTAGAGGAAGATVATGSVLWWVLIILLIILLILLIVIIIIALLVIIKPIERQYTLKETVFITEQNYHAQIVSHVNEYFYDEDTRISEDDITYVNTQINWRELLTLWYVLGCSRDGTTMSDGDTFDFTFYPAPDDSEIYELVTEHDLELYEMSLMTEAYNDLYTIISYPVERVTKYETYHFSTTDELAVKAAELGASGIPFTVLDEHTIQAKFIHRGARVECERIDVLEYAESHLSAEQYNHVVNCLNAVDRYNPNPSVEPTFYAIWQAIREATSIDIDARELIVREAYAMWIMSGCVQTGSVPQEARDFYGVDTPLSYSMYREVPGNGIPTAFRFDYMNSQGNTVESVTSALPWLADGTQNEDDVPVFLDPQYTWIGNSSIAYCDTGLQDLGIYEEDSDVDTTLTYYNNRPSSAPNTDSDPNKVVSCANMSWDTYCYHVAQPGTYGTDSDFHYAWCAAFIASLALNMHPNGCFFVHRELYIDDDHPAWTVYDPIENNHPWAEAHEEFIEAINELGTSDTLSGWIRELTAVYNAGVDTGMELALTNYINAIEICASTDYYRVDLVNTHSSLTAGLYGENSEDGLVFPPSAADTTEYRPNLDDFDDWYGIDMSDTIEFSTRHLTDGDNNLYDNATIGHANGWYSPQMDIYSNLPVDFEDRAEAYCYIAGIGGILKVMVDSCHTTTGMFWPAIVSVGDTVIDVLEDNGILQPGEFNSVFPQYVSEFVHSYFSIFGELHEEPMGYYPCGATGCGQYADYYANGGGGGTAYGPGGTSMDIYEPQIGDVVITRSSHTDENGETEWDDWYGDNGGASHIRIIVYAEPGSSMVTVIEGNASNSIRMSTISLDNSNIYVIGQPPC